VKKPDASTHSLIRSEHNSVTGVKENSPSAAVKSKGNGTKEADETHKEGYIHETSARLVLKWFYNTSSGTATRAARGGSLIGETKTLHTRDVSYEGTRWTRGFIWFRSLERNTLRLRENESCCIIVCCSSLGLKLP
jgi:hypothetical protein